MTFRTQFFISPTQLLSIDIIATSSPSGLF